MALNGHAEDADRPDDADSTLLACGRDAVLVWERAGSGIAPDEHERDCPLCAATIADARRLDSVVHRMAAEQLTPPPSVLARVLGAVLTELRPHDVLTLESTHGPAELSRISAAAVLRHTVDSMPGIRARSCRIEQVPTEAAIGAGRHAADVTITVTARFGVDLTSVLARVRQMVTAAAEQALGVPVRRVDIEVVDVLDEDSW